MQQLQASRLDVTALNQQHQDDLQAFRAATTPADFSQLIDEINAQSQETTVYSTQAIPFVGAAKLKEFSAEINLLKKYGQNSTPFQQRLQADQAALTQAKGINDYPKVWGQINSDHATIQFPLVQVQANYLLKQFHQEVPNCGKPHHYYDAYNGTSYNLDYDDDMQG